MPHPVSPITAHYRRFPPHDRPGAHKFKEYQNEGAHT